MIQTSSLKNLQEDLFDAAEESKMPLKIKNKLEALICAQFSDRNSTEFVLNNSSRSGTTALHLACRYKDKDSLGKLLKDRRVEVNPKDKYNQTPLFWACANQWTEGIELLINDDRVDVNAQDDEGRTPFYRACYSLHKPVIETLLKSSSLDLHRQSKHGFTPLAIYYIQIKGNTDFDLGLLLNDNRVDIKRLGDINILLHHKYYSEMLYDLSMFRHKQKASIKINTYRDLLNAFHFCAAENNVDFCKAAVDLIRKNPNIKGSSALTTNHSTNLFKKL